MRIFDDSNILDPTLKEQYEREINIFESIFESSMEAIMVTDIDNRIMWVNRAFEKTYQYTRTEIIGETPQLLQSDYHEQNYYLNIWDVIDHHGSWQGELWNRCKDGSIIPVHQSIIRIYSEQQDSEYIVITSYDISDKKDAELKMFQLAYLDGITGLKNRHFLQDKLKHHFCDGVLLIKIANLIRIENQYGEETANSVVKAVIKRLRFAHFHQEIYQYAPNRLVMVFKEEHLQNALDLYIKRIEKALSEPLTVENHVIDLRVIIGSILQDLRETWTLHEMVRKAQIAISYGEALTQEKHIRFTREIEKAMLDGEELIQDLKKAVHDNAIDVHFQPFVNLNNGTLYGAEALARWTHPVRGPIAPTLFIDIAEKNELINALGEQVLSKACRLAKPWLILEPQFLLSINVSVLQLVHKGFINRVEKILHETGFPPSNLSFEVTESIAIDNLDIVKNAMHELHAMGIQFSLDDFGMGFSSLSKLKSIPVSMLKIDRSFITDINENLQNSLLVSAIIAMAHHLGLGVVVEGIEEASHVRFLKNNACQIGQGYYFSPPVSSKDFEAFLGNSFTQYDPDYWVLSSQAYGLYDINQGLQHAITSTLMTQTKKPLFISQLAPQHPSIEANEMDIDHALKHLLKNAYEALENLCKTEQGVITVETSASDTAVMISITDNGPGIPQEMIGRIFDPFFTTKPHGFGTGLGLSYAKEIITNRHYGDIYVKSDYGNGATFIIELPIKQPRGRNKSDE